MATTGPALRMLDSHQSIHAGSHGEARDLTEVTEKLFEDKRQEDCFKAAEVLIEYIESRIIAHADAEDEGFYLETLEKKPDLEKNIHMLMRDHDLMRQIVKKIKEQMNKRKEVTKSIINQFHSILIIHELHARGEEENLFKDD
ncbi:MAG TPA: hemerythrin domain-containing protein [Candidatus Avamphibacillus sp.]|nr:hemerythrin domain-containing protein [Candidatus Avamphibacillus sp.]